MNCTREKRNPERETDQKGQPAQNADKHPTGREDTGCIMLQSYLFASITIQLFLHIMLQCYFFVVLQFLAS
jgi:hypothetical protein